MPGPTHGDAPPTSRGFWTGWAIFSIVTSALWLFGALALYSNAYHESFSWKAAALWAFAFLLGVHWIAYSIATVIRTRSRRGPYWWPGAELALPMAVVAWYACIATGLPFTVRLALSKHALADFADSLSDGEDHYYPLEGGARRVGLFTVQEVTKEDGCTYMITVRMFLDRGGIAYCEARATPSADRRTEHIGGRWWRYHKRF